MLALDSMERVDTSPEVARAESALRSAGGCPTRGEVAGQQRRSAVSRKGSDWGRQARTRRSRVLDEVEVNAALELGRGPCDGGSDKADLPEDHAALHQQAWHRSASVLVRRHEQGSATIVARRGTFVMISGLSASAGVEHPHIGTCCPWPGSHPRRAPYAE